MTLTLLSVDQIKQCINMRQAIDAMENAFQQLARQQAVLPLRTAIEIKKEKALCLTMPAFLQAQGSLGLKVVSVFPNNSQHAIPTINGVLLLIDSQTGQPQALMDAGYLTALRTGAVAGLATRYFAKDNARHVAIIGTGVQAASQLEAVAAVRDIQRVSVWSRNSDNAHLFAKKLAQQFDIHPCPTIQDAVKDADIICTATSSTEPLIHLAEIQPDVHINAVGSHSRSMREIANDVFSQSITIVDQIEAALAEAGEVISAIEERVIKPTSLYEIGDLLINSQAGLKEKLTVFKSVGLAIQDIAVAALVYKHALKNKLGSIFSF